MGISLKFQEWLPYADNDSSPLGNATPHTIYQPPDASAGDVFLLAVAVRNNTAPAIVDTAGQTWTSQTLNTNGTTIGCRLFSCVFNGTWTGSLTVSTASTTDGICTWFGVFTGVDSTIFDVSPTAIDFASATSKTLTGFNTGVDNSWAMFIWAEPDDNVLSGQDSGWSGPNGLTGVYNDHIGNQGGNDIGLFLSRKVQTAAGATGNNVVALDTADVGAGYYFSLKPDTTKQSTGRLNFPTIINETAYGTSSWLNAGNAELDDDSNTQVSIGAANTTSNFLKGYGLGGSVVPNNATITGIVIGLKHNAFNNPTNIALIFLGIVIAGSTNPYAYATKSAGNPNTYNLLGTAVRAGAVGGSTDLWGQSSISAAQVNANNFGGGIIVGSNHIGGFTYNVNHLWIEIFYTVPATANSSMLGFFM